MMLLYRQCIEQSKEEINYLKLGGIYFSVEKIGKELTLCKNTRKILSWRGASRGSESLQNQSVNTASPSQNMTQNNHKNFVRVFWKNTRGLGKLKFKRLTLNIARTTNDNLIVTYGSFQLYVCFPASPHDYQIL